MDNVGNGLTSGQLGSVLIPNPSWGLVFGLTLIVVVIGFFVMYLIFRMSKQEKMLDVVNKRSQNISTPDDVFGMIQQCYHSSQFQQPMMRNIHSMVETRLNDFDEYCRAKYGNTTDHAVPVSTPTNSGDAHHEYPPPLEEQTVTLPPSSPVQQRQPLVSVQHAPSVQPPHAHATPPPPQPHAHATPPPPQPHAHATPPSSGGGGGGGTSMLAEALPSLLTSLLSGGRSGTGDSNGGDVTFPVIMGDIMNLMSNQRARQQRREDMAPSVVAASPPQESNPSTPPAQ